MRLFIKNEIFAVTWEDFIPLSLSCASKEEAIAKAKEMKIKGGSNIRNVRAVHALAGTDTLIVLWGPKWKHVEARLTPKGITSGGNNNGTPDSTV